MEMRSVSFNLLQPGARCAIMYKEPFQRFALRAW